MIARYCDSLLVVSLLLMRRRFEPPSQVALISFRIPPPPPAAAGAAAEPSDPRVGSFSVARGEFHRNPNSKMPQWQSEMKHIVGLTSGGSCNNLENSNI